MARPLAHLRHRRVGPRLARGRGRGRWTAALGGSLTLVGVAPDGVSAAAPDVVAPHIAALGGIEGRHELRRGDPAEELERVAATATAPLIAVGARGLAPWRTPLLGSVTRRLLRLARRPVLVVPPSATSAATVPRR